MLKEDMKESIKLVDSLYIELITNGLKSETAKNKLISMYEKILRINVTVIKESMNDGEIESNIADYYCDLCNATSSLFEYYRKINQGIEINESDLINSLDKRIQTLNDRLETVESELYQRDIDIERLENELEQRDNMLIDKYVKEEFREKFRQIRDTWKLDKNKVDTEIREKDNIIESLRTEINSYREKLNNIKTGEKEYSSSNPAKRIDVKDQDLIDLYSSGMSPYSIGKKFNMSQSTVINRLKKYNGVYVAGGRDSRGKNGSR